MCWAKTAEPIDMLFCMKTWVGPWNHVLDEGADHPRRRISVFGKRKYYSENFWAQAMRPIDREWGGGIAQRGRSLISKVALL